MYTAHPIIAVVTLATRLSGLQARWATKKAATFRLRQAAGHELELRRRRLNRIAATSTLVDEAALEEAAEALADQKEYQEEDRVYHAAVGRLLQEIELGFPIRTIDRDFLPNFDFGRCLAVVVIGPDGLVANATKYVGDVPLVGVNPDPERNDGILVPFEVREARAAVQQAVSGKGKTREVTLAEVNLNDGQRMLAFNDFFVGCRTHVSARYTLETENRHEPQSSSGVLISTGAGSTGWLSSLFNMAEGLNRAFGGSEIGRLHLDWEARQLAWAVREPFRSRHSSADLVAGVLEEGMELVIGSQMPENGVIFSDGVEADYLEFNSGTIARFTVSSQRARLMVP